MCCYILKRPDFNCPKQMIRSWLQSPKILHARPSKWKPVRTSEMICKWRLPVPGSFGRFNSPFSKCWIIASNLTWEDKHWVMNSKQGKKSDNCADCLTCIPVPLFIMGANMLPIDGRQSRWSVHSGDEAVFLNPIQHWAGLMAVDFQNRSPDQVMHGCAGSKRPLQIISSLLS